MLNQPLFAALDVSLETTTICIMSSDGTITKEAVVATEPESIAICLGDDLTRIERIGLEAGPLSEWLVRELSVLGIVVTLLETRQVRAALSAMIIKTDRKDARGMAHLLRTGWFRPVHVKSLSAREQRAMLAARSVLVARLKDIENSVRGLLRGFGLRLPRALRGRWEAGVREAIEGHPTLVQIFEPLLLRSLRGSRDGGKAHDASRTRGAHNRLPQSSIALSKSAFGSSIWVLKEPQRSPPGCPGY
jgi:transposase